MVRAGQAIHRRTRKSSSKHFRCGTSLLYGLPTMATAISGRAACVAWPSSDLRTIREGCQVNTFATWLFAGFGVAVGSAAPSFVSSALSWMRRGGTRLIDLLQPKERYNSLHLTTWAVEVMGQRENPDDPVVLKVEGSRATAFEQSIRQTGLIAEPLTSEQRQAVQAAMRDYGPAGPGYWRRHLPEWTRRELLLARFFAVSRGTERCMVFGGMIPDTTWVAVCLRPRWHRGAHRWERFSVGTLTAQDPGPSDN